MQARKRYLLLISFFLLGGILRFIFLLVSSKYMTKNVLPVISNELETEPTAYIEFEDLLSDENNLLHFNNFGVETHHSVDNPKLCTMSECFNYSICEKSFKIHIYPSDLNPASENGKVSEVYGKILAALKNLNFYTSNPEEACLFVLSFDTLDRDVLSGDYVKNLRSKFNNLPENLWNGGLNHLIFNLYPGTWPNYESTDLGFDTGKAIVAKASFSVDHFRSHFDVSLPLFHKTLPLSGQSSSYSVFDAGTPQRRSYLLVFKGKRYVYGIGSETRNSLYHLHNGRDVIMLTTCKHGKNWKQVKDDRCETDNEIYDKWNYEELFQNSSFCLIPRGRRYGSFRFLEAMEAGCIPVVLSNEWELPFSEVIDWKSAAIWADERLLFQLPSFLRSIPIETVMNMRQQAKHLSRLYFSSVEQIVFTAIEIIKNRLNPSMAPDSWVWNRMPGGIRSYLKEFSDVPNEYPRPFVQRSGVQKFTAIIIVSKSMPIDLGSLWKLIGRVLKSKFAQKVYVVFSFGQNIPQLPRGFDGSKRVELISDPQNYFNGFGVLNLIFETDSVFIIDSQANLNTDEVDFAVEVWRWFQHRIVGYSAYNHFWNSEEKRYKLTSAMSNCYSIITDSALLVHRYYLQYYEAWTKQNGEPDVQDGCFDIRLNYLVSDLIDEPPIKLTSKQIMLNDFARFESKQKCFDELLSNLSPSSELALSKSCSRFDPVLYKDTVSNLRKKYRQMELNR